MSLLGEEKQAGLVQNIHLAVQDAIEKANLKIKGQVGKSMQDTIMKTVNRAPVKTKEAVEQAMRKEMKVLEQEVELKIWCETEKLEKYIIVSLD